MSLTEFWSFFALCPSDISLTTKGDLYSVKIMWPRTPEERARGRNTGFVCFMKRQDAEVAMSTYQDSDPLNTGRCMCLGWGKNMKKMVKKGGAGVIRGKRQIYSGSGDPNENGDKRLKNPDEPESYSGLPGQEKTSFSKQSKAVVETPVYDPSKHTASAIRVIAPADPRRLKFITTIASFVAKDGSVLEELLRTRKSSDANFAFLQEHNDATDRVRTEERIFYRWRVFSFTQGDGINSWRTEPFVMVLPNGRFWIPPPLDAKAALLEEMKREEQEIMIRSQVETRRKMSIQKGFMTGRQLERTRHGALVGAAKLNNDELKEWEDILMNRLCSSRESICEAMAFSIEKSGAALHISDLLKKALLDDRRGVSIETRIARLYLMSDILFNSQQPGVKNAFRYRDAIEAMSPEIFRNFGQHGNGKAGRITMNKLGKAVSTVLRAWTSWSVYNPNFLEELQAAFEGKTTDAIKVAESESMSNGNAESIVSTEKEEEPCTEEIQLSAEVVMPQTEWTDAKDAEDDSNQPDDFNEIQTNDDIAMDGEPLEDDDIDSAELIDEEVDGVSLRHSEIDYGSFSDED